MCGAHQDRRALDDLADARLAGWRADDAERVARNGNSSRASPVHHEHGLRRSSAEARTDPKPHDQAKFYDQTTPGAKNPA